MTREGRLRMTGVGRTCVCAHGVWRLLCRPYKTAAPLGAGADGDIGPYIRHSERSEESVPCSFVPGQEYGFFACGSE